MPYFLADFMRQHRGVDLVMDVTNKTWVVESLEQNAVDFALVSVIPEQLQLQRVELMQNKLYLVGSARNQWPTNTPRQKIFEEYPLLYREQGSATRAAMEAFIQKKKLPTYKKMTLTSNEALKQAVIAGLGYSIMPLIGIKNELKNGSLQIIPFSGLPLVSHWNLIWLKAKKLTPVAEAFLEYINQEKDTIIREHFEWFEQY